MSARKLKLSVAGLVLLHLVVVSLHGVAHQRMGIDLEGWQRVFVDSAIFAGPLVGLAVLWISARSLAPFCLLCPWLALSCGRGNVANLNR